jgi:hypothetical protein
VEMCHLRKIVHVQDRQQSPVASHILVAYGNLPEVKQFDVIVQSV